MTIPSATAIGWRGASLHDARVAGRASAPRRGDPSTPSDAPDPTERVRCPGLPDRACGRRIMAQELRDVSGCDPAVVGAATYLCDACEQLVLLEGRSDVADWFRGRGAPPAVVQQLVAKAAWQRAIPDTTPGPLSDSVSP